MSRTRKDSIQHGTIVEVVKREDGTFDFFRNHKLDRERIPFDGLVDEICVRYGYCGQEFDSIVGQLQTEGNATMRF